MNSINKLSDLFKLLNASIYDFEEDIKLLERLIKKGLEIRN